MSDRVARTALPPEAAGRMEESLAAHRRGEFALAEQGYCWLTERFPSFADAWHYYGILRHQRGEGDEAVTLLRRAEALAPGNSAFLLNFGRILGERGEYTQAMAYLGKALRIAPAQDATLLAYARLMVEIGRGADVVSRLERRIRDAPPAGWQFWALLAKSREQSDDRAGVLQALDEAVARAPEGDIAQHLRVAKTAFGGGDAIASELAFRAALQISATSAAAHLRLAELAMENGDWVRAREWAGAAISQDRRLWRAWALLAACSEESRDPVFIGRLEEAVRAGGEDTAIAPLHFALGWLYEKHGGYDRAFACYERGNCIQGRRRSYDRAQQEAYVTDLVWALDGDFVKRAEAIGDENSSGIFICGMPRSGTTLIEAILAAHPDVAAGGEMGFVHNWLNRAVGTSLGQEKTGSSLRELSDEKLRALAHEWAGHLESVAAGATRVTDKMPGNYHLLGLIHVCFPRASIVYVRRDPRDTGLSCFTTYFERGHFFSHDLESIGHYYRLHERMMAHWRRTFDPRRIVDVDYEALVTRPEHEIARLLAALNLSWDPACLRFYENRRAVRTASLTQVRQPFYRTSIGRWRRFERQLRPLMAALALASWPD